MTGRWLEPQITPSPPPAPRLDQRSALWVDLWILIQPHHKDKLSIYLFLLVYKITCRNNLVSFYFYFLCLCFLSCRRQCGSCPTLQQVTSNKCRLSLMQNWSPWSSTCSTRLASVSAQSSATVLYKTNLIKCASHIEHLNFRETLALRKKPPGPSVTWQ